MRGAASASHVRPSLPLVRALVVVGANVNLPCTPNPVCELRTRFMFWFDSVHWFPFELSAYQFIFSGAGLAFREFSG